MNEHEIIKKLAAYLWEQTLHKWWCKDSLMIGKCNCGAKEIFDFLESLKP